MNKTTLVGRLTRDPELKFTPNTGTAVCTFIIAVSRRFKKEGQPDVDFIPIVVWGKMAEVTANYMSKGRLIGVSGRIEIRNYTVDDGTKRYVTEVIAEDVEFLGSKEQNSAESKNKDVPEYGSDVTPVANDDIPF